MQVTVKSSMPTGKEDPKFGAEYYVQFNEIQDTAAFWFKKQPETDQPMEIEQVNGKWKKVKKEWNPSSSPSPQAGSSESSQPSSSYRRVDNSDGMRQGMCINNAANFVNNQVHDKILNAEEWATAVHNYAQALYAKGDLSVPETKPTTVAQVFGPVEEVPVNG